MSPLFSLPKWAAANPKTARLLIIILSLFSAVLFFEFGLYLPEINFWGAIFMWSAAVLLAAYAYYSYKKGNTPIKRTIIYFCLGVLWIHLGNQSLPFLSVSDSNITELSTASVGPIKPIAMTEKQIQKFIKNDNDTMESPSICDSYFRKKAPRILCTIFTKREVHSTKMKAIHDTMLMLKLNKRLFIRAAITIVDLYRAEVGGCRVMKLFDFLASR